MPRFSLKTWLLFFILLSISFGLIAVAAYRHQMDALTYITIAAAACALGAGIGFIVNETAAMSSLILFLAALSFATTSSSWGGSFPYGEVRITIVDQGQSPIDNAIVSILDNATGNSALPSPLEISRMVDGRDGRGRVVCRSTRQGQLFNGSKFLLFWCIPIGNRDPGYVCKISCNGFHPTTFALTDLFDSPSGATENNLPIYRKTIVMQPIR